MGEQARAARVYRRQVLEAAASQLSAVRASYAEFESNRDPYELARAVGNILGADGRNTSG